MKNKKAVLGSQATIFWFLFLAFIFLGSLVVGIYIFFGGDYDYRQINADTLNYRIRECLIEHDIEFDNSTFEREFYTTCRINKEHIENNFFLLIRLDGNIFYETGKGDETQCGLSDRNEEYPRCQNATIVKENKIIFIETGNNQISIKERI